MYVGRVAVVVAVVVVGVVVVGGVVVGGVVIVIAVILAAGCKSREAGKRKNKNEDK